MARSLVPVVALTLLLVALIPSAGEAAVPAIQPRWTELTPEQKQVLAPLAGEWDRLELYRQKKWLGIALRYSTMSPQEQERVQRRMREWVKLSPEERKAAREKYKSLRNAPPDHKEVVKQKWQEYKELPDEERERLKQQAMKAKPVPRPGKSAAVPLSPLKPPSSPQPSSPEPVSVPQIVAEPKPPTPDAAPIAPSLSPTTH